jgi:glycosyl transferase family 9 (putative heptosyltransferase)
MVPQELDPVLLCQPTLRGWRGLTAHGLVLDVQSHPGQPRAIPPLGDKITMVLGGVRVGTRAMPDAPCNGEIQEYLNRQSTIMKLFQQNQFHDALNELEAALPTSYMRFVRALVLLSLGRWREGFADLEARLDLSFPKLCQQAVDAGIPCWQGEDLCGKHLLLVHDAGYGDTIQMLRYVPRLRGMGAQVSLLVPDVLQTFVAQMGLMVNGADYYCPIWSLSHMLGEKIDRLTKPYMVANPRPSKRGKHKIGVAWSVGRTVDGDYPRAVPLELLMRHLRRNDVELYSIQVQETEEAKALGVKIFPLKDFDECAELIAGMDEIVTVDTAAVHVAGSIGHPNIKLLLSAWHSWRWRDDAPIYQNMKFCRQDTLGDWESALRKLYD